MKIRRILVDLDPKQANQTAIDRALRLAGSCNASIDLFASVNVQWFASDISVDAAIMQQSREEYFAALESWVAELAAPLRAAGVEVSSGCKWAHPRHAAIIKRASEIDADLIIRMAHMHNRLERLFLSATDWELIRHAPQALWLVKETEAQPAVFNLLAAVDPASPDAVHVELDQRLLEAAVALNKSLPGELHIFHAFEPPTAVAALPLAGGAGAAAAPLPRVDVKLIDAVRDMHRSRLDEIASRFGVDEQHRHLSIGDTANAIADTVEEHDINIAIVGAVGRNWLQRWLVGSTAEEVFEAVDCDVFVVKLEALGDARGEAPEKAKAIKE